MVVCLTKQVTVSARIDVELRRKLKELGIRPSEVIKKALEREVEERLKLQLYGKVERASEIIRRVGRDAWIKAIRESRDEK